MPASVEFGALREIARELKVPVPARNAECLVRGGGGEVELAQFRVGSRQCVERSRVLPARDRHGVLGKRAGAGAVARAGIARRGQNPRQPVQQAHVIRLVLERLRVLRGRLLQAVLEPIVLAKIAMSVP